MSITGSAPNDPAHALSFISVFVMLLCLTTGCRRESPSPTTAAPHRVSTSAVSSETPTQRVAKWLFVGDSLTAGYGLSKEEAYVSQLERRLAREGWHTPDQHEIKLMNAGISGDTSAGALRRIDWLLEEDVERVFVCIGANDGLRGQPIEALRANLTQIIKRIRASGAQVVLMGMKLPPNYGPLYTARFAKVYAEIAQELGVSFLPFLLEGVGGRAEYNQADGIHPNREGQARIADLVFDFLHTQNLIKRR